MFEYAKCLWLTKREEEEKKPKHTTAAGSRDKSKLLHLKEKISTLCYDKKYLPSFVAPVEGMVFSSSLAFHSYWGNETAAFKGRGAVFTPISCVTVTSMNQSSLLCLLFSC